MVKKRTGLFATPLRIGISVLIFLAILLAVLELTNTTHIFHKKKVPAIIPVVTSKSSSNANQKSTSTSPTSTTEPSNLSSKTPSSTAGSGSNLPLVEPYGSFVSNHYPGQNGSSTDEQSVCNSTPGATCYIQFTNTSSGDITKLPTQTTDSNGSTVWNWNAKILSSGQWQITAIANLNGQTKSTSDSLKLVIQ